MDDELLQEFLAESMENLARLDNEIVELEKKPGDGELLASIFRTIHTIKGTCGFIGLTGLGSVAHSAENVLGKMRDGVLAATEQSISLILQGVDEIKELLSGLEATGEEPVRDNTALIAALDQLAASGEQPTAEEPAAEQPEMIAEPEAPEEPQAEVTETRAAPSPDAQSTELDSAAPNEDIAMPTSPTPELQETVEQSAADLQSDEPQQSNKKSVSDLSIRVNVDVLDSLMNLVGELVLTRNQLLQMIRGDDESKYAAPITHLNRVTTDLQEGVMKTRMQPIGNAWSKLPRLVRDLAQQTDKQIDLEMLGAETELDRTVLDAIKDPLMHMVRNSADHGLESTQARREAGKPEIGNIRLNAFHEGGHVIICIDDDGAGINAERVLQKAIENGLISEADGARLNEKEMINFVFKPGFSTAQAVTSVSGRGVGMDVVKTQIERIGGTVDLISRRGQGTSVRIKIPLTLAIVSALVVESGGLSFAIPQLAVVELVRLAAEDRDKIEKIHENEVFRLRDRLLPLLHLDEILGLKDERRDDVEQDINIVVVQVGDDQFGLIVSEVFDTEEIVVKPVGKLLKEIDIYQGTTILGDGRVIMILDVAGIASQFEDNSGRGDRDQQQADRDSEAKSDTTTLLLFDAGRSSPMAVPLSLVARLEEFHREQIENMGNRKVVQYRENLLPLLPVNGYHSEDGSPDPQPVIVFTEGDQAMGLVVHEILDIIEETLLIRMQSQEPGVLGTAIINGKATDVIDTQYYVEQAAPDWFSRKSKTISKRVLVIDDSIFIRQIVMTTLETEGYQTVVCDSAIEAVEMIEHGEQFDVIVSDIEMPMMDGFEFAEWFNERNHANTTPMIALTSLSGSHVETRAQEAGFARFLTKLNKAQFLNCVKELSHQSERREAIA